MKKKIISLVAILVLASMMLVMFTGCTSYKSLKVCNIKGQKDFIVELCQYYDDSTGKYDKNKFRVQVSYIEGTNCYIGSVDCNFEQLKSGVQVKVLYTGSLTIFDYYNVKPSIYITGVTFDKTGKISDSCTPKCEMRLQGRQYIVDMKNI